MHSARSNAYGLPNPSLPAQLNLSLSTHLLDLESVTVTVIDFHQGGLESVTQKSPYFHSDAPVHLNESTCRTATCQLAPVDFSALQMSYLSPVGASPSAATGLISRGKAVLPTILDFLGSDDINSGKVFSPSHFVSPVKLQKSPCLGNCKYDAAQSVQNSPSLILSLRHGTAPRADLFGASHFGASSYFDEDLGTQHYNKWDTENLWGESEEEAKNGEDFKDREVEDLDFKDREVEDLDVSESVLTCGLQSIAGAFRILADAGQNLTLSPEKSVEAFDPTMKAGQGKHKVKGKRGGYRFCCACQFLHHYKTSCRVSTSLERAVGDIRIALNVPIHDAYHGFGPATIALHSTFPTSATILASRGKEAGAAGPKLEQAEMGNKNLRQDGEARNLSREERKMLAIMRQIQEMEHTEKVVKAGPWSTELEDRVCHGNAHVGEKRRLGDTCYAGGGESAAQGPCGHGGGVRGEKLQKKRKKEAKHEQGPVKQTYMCCVQGCGKTFRHHPAHIVHEKAHLKKQTHHPSSTLAVACLIGTPEETDPSAFTTTEPVTLVQQETGKSKVGRQMVDLTAELLPWCAKGRV